MCARRTCHRLCLPVQCLLVASVSRACDLHIFKCVKAFSHSSHECVFKTSWFNHNVKVQLLTVDHSAHRSMKNRASSDKRCELQDTPNTRFSNAHCTFGSFPKVRLSEGRNKIDSYEGSHREKSACCYTFVEHETFSVMISQPFAACLVRHKSGYQRQHYPLLLRFQPLSYKSMR